MSVGIGQTFQTTLPILLAQNLNRAMNEKKQKYIEIMNYISR